MFVVNTKENELIKFGIITIKAIKHEHFRIFIYKGLIRYIDCSISNIFFNKSFECKLMK